MATHARNIVHRDLSPDNIVLRGDDPAEAVIIDFGIAKDASAGARTIVGNDFAGKYEYAAPEQMHGRAEPRSDLYALGASLLAIFRGRVPDMGGSPGEVLRRKEQPLDTAGVPEPLKGLIDTLTQPDPARRPPSAAAAVAEIEGLLRPKPAAPPRAAAALARSLAPVARCVAVAGRALGFRARWTGCSAPPPVASPYVLIAERPADGPASLAGNAPDAAGARRDRGGLRPAPPGRRRRRARSTLASGAPVADWAAAVAAMLAAARAARGVAARALRRRGAPDRGRPRRRGARRGASRRFEAAATGARLAARRQRSPRGRCA